MAKAKKNAGGVSFSAKQTLSPKMMKFMGGQATASSPEIITALWAYIKRHKLQDPSNKRNIEADAVLEELFGKSYFTMFEMTKMMSQHFIKD